MKRIRTINPRNAVSAIATPLKKKGIAIEPGSDAEKAIVESIKAANRGIRVLNEFLSGGERIVEEGRDAIHQATRPKPTRKRRK